MSKKILGFEEKDGYRGKHFTGRESEVFWQIRESDIISAISSEKLKKLCKANSDYSICFGANVKVIGVKDILNFIKKEEIKWN